MADPSYDEFPRADAQTEARRRHPPRLLWLFLAPFLGMQYIWKISRETTRARFVIHGLTVRPAAGMIDALWPGTAVQAQGHRLGASTGRLNIHKSFEALETPLGLLHGTVLPPTLAHLSRYDNAAA